MDEVLPSPLLTFLGQSGAAHEEEGCGIVSEGPGAMLGSPGQGHLAHPMGPRRGVTDWPLAGDITMRGKKLALSKGGKQQWDGFSSSC